MAKNNILGKLMAERSAEAFDNGIRNILYTEIKPSEKNKFILSKVDELAEDIKENGLDHNIVVREIEDSEYKYEIVAGERRYTAICRNIEGGDTSYKFIPAKIQRYDDENAEKRLILNNLQSRVISPSEMLEAVESLQRLYQSDKEKGIKLPGRVRELIAEDLGIGMTQVGTYQKISNDAIPEVKEMLAQEEITIATAAELAKLEEEEQLMFIQDKEELNLQTIREYRDTLENVSVTDTKSSISTKATQIEMDDEQSLSRFKDKNVSVTDTNDPRMSSIEELIDEDYAMEDEDYESSIYDYEELNLDYDDENSSTITGLIESITKDFNRLETKVKGVEFREERYFLDDAIERFNKFKISLGISD